MKLDEVQVLLHAAFQAGHQTPRRVTSEQLEARFQDWLVRCSSCAGTGTVRSIRGYGACETAEGGPLYRPCAKCDGSGVAA